MDISTKFKHSLEDLVMAIVYSNQSENEIDQIYKDLRTLRNLKALKNSEHPRRDGILHELDMFINYFKKIFKSKSYILEIDGEFCEKEFIMTIGDDDIWEDYDCCREAIEAGAMEIIFDRSVCRISGADLVKYGIADVSEILWNIFRSGVSTINVVDVKTGKKTYY